MRPILWAPFLWALSLVLISCTTGTPFGTPFPTDERVVDLGDTMVGSSRPLTDSDVIDAIGGYLVQPKSLINVTVWPGDALKPGFVFPELSDGEFGIPALQEKASFGIGVSGGGLRAFTMALGYLRGMHQLGLLKKARYLGSASGGSMANLLISYSDPSTLNARFGRYYPPKDLTLANMRRLGTNTYASALANMNNMYQTFLENIIRQEFAPAQEGETTAGAYTRSLSQLVLSPFGLDRWDSTVTALGTRGEVHKRIRRVAKEMGLKKVYSWNSEMPYPLVCGNVFDPADDMPFNPLEFTPLYIGAPGDYRKYNEAQDPIGGGLMEPLGMNARIVSAPPPSREASTRPATVLVNSTYVVPLASHIAVSGGIMAVELHSIINAGKGKDAKKSALLGQPYFDFFNFYNYKTNTYPFADGGYLDNEGLWAMLRRKLQKIIIFYSGPSPGTSRKEWTASNSGISLAFGACEDCFEYLEVPTAKTNEAAQVFERAAFEDLYNAYHANVNASRVNVHVARLKVLENKFMGVQGGWEVDIMFVMNSANARYERLLPRETRDLIAKGRTMASKLKQAITPLQNYELTGWPFFPIFMFRYSPTAVGSLVNYGTWQVLEIEQRIRSFLAN